MTREEKIEYLAKAVMTLGELGDNKTAYALNEIRLELKGQTELPEGLEEAAEEYAHSLGYDEEKERVEIAAAKDDFIAGAEWQRKQDQSLIELAEDHAMLAGMNKMKEQMMEKAFRCEIIKSRTHMPHLKPYFFSSDYGKIGDKVKVIVIPE